MECRYEQKVRRGRSKGRGIRARGSLMIWYVSLDEQINKDFHRSCRKTFPHCWNSRLREDYAYHDRLLSFNEAKCALVAWSQAYLPGIRPVGAGKTTERVGINRGFDGSFSQRCIAAFEISSQFELAKDHPYGGYILQGRGLNCICYID